MAGIYPRAVGLLSLAFCEPFGVGCRTFTRSALFLALQGFFDAFHLLYEKICSEFFTNGRFCGIIPEELFHGKSSGLSPLRGLSPACGIDGFAKTLLQASIFASWYNTRRNFFAKKLGATSHGNRPAVAPNRMGIDTAARTKF